MSERRRRKSHRPRAGLPQVRFDIVEEADQRSVSRRLDIDPGVGPAGRTAEDAGFNRGKMNDCMHLALGARHEAEEPIAAGLMQSEVAFGVEDVAPREIPEGSDLGTVVSRSASCRGRLHGHNVHPSEALTRG